MVLVMRTSRISFMTGALEEPVQTNTAVEAALTTGSVRVTRSGGGLGESVMCATTRLLSFNFVANYNPRVSRM